MKKINIRTFLVLLVGFSLYAGLLVPLYTQLASNIAYQGGWLCTLLYYAYNAVDLFVFFWVYAAVAYVTCFGGWKSTLTLSGIYAGMVVYKYTANYLVGSLVDGALSSWTIFIRDDLPLIGRSLLWEFGQYLVVIGLFALILRKTRRRLAETTDYMVARSGLFPFSRVVERNPLHGAALAASITVTLVRVWMHLIYQLAQLVYSGSSEGWLIITVDLVGDLLIGVMGYFVMILLMQWMDRSRLNDLAQKEEEA